MHASARMDAELGFPNDGDFAVGVFSHGNKGC